MKTTTKKNSTKSKLVSMKEIKNIEQHIQKRAYEIYLNRGDAPGNAENDWLRAEYEFKFSVN